MVENLTAMQETQIKSLDQEDALEKGMATLVLLPGEFHGQRSLEVCSAWGHRVGHNQATNTFTRFVIAFLPKSKYLFNFMTAVTVYSEF